MTKGIMGKEPDPREVYADIIDLPHHVSDHHPPMSLYDRAAQFSPYSALSGYGDLVREEARLVGNKIEPGEDMLEQLNIQLDRLGKMIENGIHPSASVTRFIPDLKKTGGKYETTVEKIRKIDLAAGTVILDRTVGKAGTRMSVPIGDILEIVPEESFITPAVSSEEFINN